MVNKNLIFALLVKHNQGSLLQHTGDATPCESSQTSPIQFSIAAHELYL